MGVSDSLERRRDEIGKWIDEGIALARKREFWRAIEYYDKVLAIEPSSWAALNNKAFALSNLGRLDEALRCVEEALKLNPECAESWIGKATICMDLGRTKEAISCFETGLKLPLEDSKKAETLSMYGNFLAAIGEQMKAEKCFRLALVLEPQNFTVLVNIGISYLYSKNADKAREFLKRAIDTVPKVERGAKMEQIKQLLSKFGINADHFKL